MFWLPSCCAVLSVRCQSKTSATVFQARHVQLSCSVVLMKQEQQAYCGVAVLDSLCRSFEVPESSEHCSGLIKTSLL